MPAQPPILDGDTSFMGVNMRLEPSQLPPGFCASAKNKRFVNGKAATRSGIKKMGWTNKAADAWAEQSYSAGAIVTYSGRAATVSGASAAVINGGTGTMSLSSTNAILTNGDFSSGGSWSTAAETNNGVAIGGLAGSSGWAINSAKGEHTAHSNGADNFYQDINAVLGCDYTVTFTITGRSAGTVTVFIGTVGNSGALNTNATHTVTVTGNGNAPYRIYFQASQDFDGAIDTISIAEGATPENVLLTPPVNVGTDYWISGGPASNNSLVNGTTDVVGPFFKRDDSTNPGTEPPVATYNAGANTSVLTSGWNNLGHRVYG